MRKVKKDGSNFYLMVNDYGVIGRFFKIKPSVKRYKQSKGTSYIKSPSVKAVFTQDGTAMKFNSYIVKEIEKLNNKF